MCIVHIPRICSADCISSQIQWNMYVCTVVASQLVRCHGHRHFNTPLTTLSMWMSHVAIPSTQIWDCRSTDVCPQWPGLLLHLASWARELDHVFWKGQDDQSTLDNENQEGREGGGGIGSAVAVVDSLAGGGDRVLESCVFSYLSCLFQHDQQV